MPINNASPNYIPPSKDYFDSCQAGFLQLAFAAGTSKPAKKAEFYPYYLKNDGKGDSFQPTVKWSKGEYCNHERARTEVHNGYRMAFNPATCNLLCIDIDIHEKNYVTSRDQFDLFYADCIIPELGAAVVIEHTENGVHLFYHSARIRKLGEHKTSPDNFKKHELYYRNTRLGDIIYDHLTKIHDPSAFHGLLPRMVGNDYPKITYDDIEKYLAYSNDSFYATPKVDLGLWTEHFRNTTLFNQILHYRYACLKKKHTEKWFSERQERVTGYAQVAGLPEDEIARSVASAKGEAYDADITERATSVAVANNTETLPKPPARVPEGAPRKKISDADFAAAYLVNSTLVDNLLNHEVIRYMKAEDTDKTDGTWYIYTPETSWSARPFMNRFNYDDKYAGSAKDIIFRDIDKNLKGFAEGVAGDNNFDLTETANYSSNAVKTVLEHVRNSIPTVLPDTFDMDPEVIGLPDMTKYNLFTGERSKITPEDKIIRLTNYVPDFDNEPVEFLRFLKERLTDPNTGDKLDDIIEYILQHQSQGLTLIDEPRIFLLFGGDPRTGKDVIFNIIAQVYGESSDDPKKLSIVSRFDTQKMLEVKDDHDEYQTQLAVPVRYAIGKEFPKTRITNTSTFNDLVGSNIITSRGMYGSSRKYKVVATFCGTSNHEVKIPANSGMNERIAMILCNNYIPVEERPAFIRRVDDILETEGSMILGLLIKKLRVLKNNDWKLPALKCVGMFRADIAEESDYLSGFCANLELVDDRNDWVHGMRLYDLYRHYAKRIEQRKDNIVNDRTFMSDMRERYRSRIRGISEPKARKAGLKQRPVFALHPSADMLRILSMRKEKKDGLWAFVVDGNVG